MIKTNTGVEVQQIFESFLMLGSSDYEAKAELEWELEDKVYREIFTYNGVEVEVDDQSLEENEITIISVDGTEIDASNTFKQLTVPDFIKKCCN